MIALLLRPSLYQRGTHSVRVKVTHNDRRRRAVLHHDRALSSRSRDPPGRRVRIEPPRRGDTPRGPRDRRELCASDGAEGHAGSLRTSHVRNKGAAVHNECEKRRGEEQVSVFHVLRLGLQVEEHDCVRRRVAERATGAGRDYERAGAGRVGLGAAVEMTDVGERGERGKAECAERGEARNAVIAFVDDDPRNAEVIVDEVGNDECILSEETEAGVGRPFGGQQLDKRRFNIERGKELRDTHAMCLPLFPAYQEEHIHVRDPRRLKRDKKSKIFSYNLDQNVAVTENQTYCYYENVGLLGKRMVLASGKAEQTYFQGMMSVSEAILVRFPSGRQLVTRRECGPKGMRAIIRTPSTLL